MISGTINAYLQAYQIENYMKNVLLVPISALLLVSVACSKDDKDPAPTPPTSVELITSNTWRIDTMGLDANKDGVIDGSLPVQLKPCERDNTLTFSSDSTGVFSEGASKCKAEDPDTKNITWYFKSNDQILFIDGLETDLDGDANVVSLTDSTLILARPVSYPIIGEANLIVALKE